MSRAFLKNESTDDPVVIPARAPLPLGVTNYVTPRGLTLLHTELAELEAERGFVQINIAEETDRTRRLAELNGRIGALNQRIASAKVVQTHGQAQVGEGKQIVRFGATITLHSRSIKSPNGVRQLTIVGVDEADASHGLIAFTTPVARLMLGKKAGEQISLRTPQGENVMEIINISYKE